VTVPTQPVGVTSPMASFFATGVTGEMTMWRVEFSTATFSLSGTLIGPASDAQVTLDNNGADP
jgi:hypothetical protein